MTATPAGREALLQALQEALQSLARIQSDVLSPEVSRVPFDAAELSAPSVRRLRRVQTPDCPLDLAVLRTASPLDRSHTPSPAAPAAFLLPTTSPVDATVTPLPARTERTPPISVSPERPLANSHAEPAKTASAECQADLTAPRGVTDAATATEPHREDDWTRPHDGGGDGKLRVPPVPTELGRPPLGSGAIVPLRPTCDDAHAGVISAQTAMLLRDDLAALRRAIVESMGHRGSPLLTARKDPPTPASKFNGLPAAQVSPRRASMASSSDATDRSENERLGKELRDVKRRLQDAHAGRMHEKELRVSLEQQLEACHERLQQQQSTIRSLQYQLGASTKKYEEAVRWTAVEQLRRQGLEQSVTQALSPCVSAASKSESAL